MRVAQDEYQKLDLWAHSFLRDVPLHDVFVIDLPGGGTGRTVGDVHALLSPEAALKANPLVAALFRIRFFVGRLFGWDDPEPFAKHSYVHRLDAADRANSLVAPGTQDGPFLLLHLLPGESLREMQNATVHAFLCEALLESESGYRYYWGVYVKPMSRLTPLYMAMIKPFRHWLVYPAILRRIKKAWLRSHGEA
ncbi:MAG: DUF2867 domain-containing protein [Planctomycetes bacterium]|nr:DUF2867 domain-containing protein [Planctomycetota bacterium]